MLKAYFDESGTSSTELTVAGYIFEAARMDEFCDEWNAVLGQYRLPYFHMVECAHGNRVFSEMEKTDRTRIQITLMRLIKRFAVNGFVSNLANDKDDKASSYEKAALGAVSTLADWSRQTGNQAGVEILFEEGAQGKGRLDRALSAVETNPIRLLDQRYDGHRFIAKQGNPGVQAADLLAWQYHNFTKKRADEDVARLDLRALLRHPHLIADECGEPPRQSRIENITDSRERLETVFYLPRISERDAAHRGVLRPSTDTVLLRPERIFPKQTVLACPSCFRGISEAPRKSLRNVVFRCWCGTFCDTPPIQAPFAKPFW